MAAKLHQFALRRSCLSARRPVRASLVPGHVGERGCNCFPWIFGLRQLSWQTLMLITHPGVQGSKDPGMHSQSEPKFRLLTGYVELDIATAQLAGGAISIGQRNRERVHTDTGLAVVRYIDVISKTTLAIHLSGAADVAAGGASGEIRGDTVSMHFHTISMSDVLKVPPQRPVLDSPRHTKVGPSRVGGYPSTARNEVIRGVAVRLTRTLGNVGVC